MQEAEYTHHELATLVHRSSCFANTQGHVLLLVHAQFHYHNAAEVTIATADGRITSRYLNYRYYRSAKHTPVSHMTKCRYSSVITISAEKNCVAVSTLVLNPDTIPAQLKSDTSG